MKTRASVLLIIICMLVDDLFQFAFPADATMQGISILPHIGFLALMLVMIPCPWVTRLLASLLAGIVTDFFIGESFPHYAILYTVLGGCIGLFSVWIQDSLFKRFLICLAAVFLLDLLPFLLYSWTQSYDLSLSFWFWHYEIGTLIFNGFGLFILQYVSGVMDRYFTIRMHRMAKQDKKIYRNLRFKSK